jgi:topoisomerase IV subunit B
MAEKEVKYNEDSIKTLEWNEHIRLRPGMYIGKLGDGSSPDDGIYILLKETLDNCIDEFVMGNGKSIDVTIKEKTVRVRDYGRGIPLGKLVDVVSKINTGAKYDSEAFKKSVGLNGVGTKAVNALSSYFVVQAFRDNQTKSAEFTKGKIVKEDKVTASDARKGTLVTFTPDETIFGKYHFVNEYIEKMLWNYAYLNTGLTINYNGQKFHSENGLLDLLTQNINGPILYPTIHLKGYDIEVAISNTVKSIIHL